MANLDSYDKTQILARLAAGLECPEIGFEDIVAVGDETNTIVNAINLRRDRSK